MKDLKITSLMAENEISLVVRSLDTSPTSWALSLSSLTTSLGKSGSGCSMQGRFTSAGSVGYPTCEEQIDRILASNCLRRQLCKPPVMRGSPSTSPT
jgi:hypothetical protein